jgi:hypothetical protein
MVNQVHDERETSGQMVDALDFIRCDEIARLADLAASYWRSIMLAADRGETHILVLHAKQVAAVTRSALSIVRTLGEEDSL